MSEAPLRYDLEDGIAWLRLDDGKANAISHAVIRALHDACDRAEKEARAAVLLGRAGRFSAGFDLATMRQGPEAAGDLVAAGAEVLLRLYGLPLPVVVGCSGHALAMGALLLLGGDRRVGIAGDFKIGLNEVAISMTLPPFAIGMAQERLSRRHLQRATVLAEIYTPESALDAGWLDRVVAPDALEATLREEAGRLAELPQPALAGTKRRLRGPAIEQMRAELGRSRPPPEGIEADGG